MATTVEEAVRRRGRGRRLRRSPRAPRRAGTARRSTPPASCRSSARSRWCRRSSTPSPCRWSRPAGSPTGAGWPRRSRSAPARRADRHAVPARREAATAPGYREALLRAVETDTVVTTAFTGRAGPVDPQPPRPRRRRRAAAVAAAARRGRRPLRAPRSSAGESELHPLLAGQNLRGLARRPARRRRSSPRSSTRPSACSRAALEFGHAADSRPARARRAPRRLHLRDDRRARQR